MYMMHTREGDEGYQLNTLRCSRVFHDACRKINATDDPINIKPLQRALFWGAATVIHSISAPAPPMRHQRNGTSEFATHNNQSISSIWFRFISCSAGIYLPWAHKRLLYTLLGNFLVYDPEPRVRYNYLYPWPPPKSCRQPYGVSSKKLFRLQ